MKSALSSKVAENNLIVVDSISFDEYSTKKFVKMLDAVKADKKTLVVFDLPQTAEAKDGYKKAVASAANIKGVATTHNGQLNVYELLKYEKCVMTKEAVAAIEAVYSDKEVSA
jgi:large subunit ribosomal protein L4